MNGYRKSDTSVVSKKSSNKSDNVEAEKMEKRGVPEENKRQQNTRQTQGWESVQNQLQLIHQKAKADKKMKFTNLMHHIYNINTLRNAYLELKRDAAPGVDKETWRSYEISMEANLKQLSDKLKSGAYKAKPVRRTYIPKANGKLRPLGITTLEDKIVQRATVEVMNTIYEADFVGFSYGFRPKRSQHQALDAVYMGIETKKVNYVFDADICDFFNKIDRRWLIKFIEHRIRDERVIRLIKKWLNAGILEEGKITYNDFGLAQGSGISPLLANIYLHYVYDMWVARWRKQSNGDVIVVRYADDTVVGFQLESEAKKFQEELKNRLLKFGLEMNVEKTRLIEFGRFAAERREKRKRGKPETFTFLGFTHICGTRIKDGKFTVWRKTIKKRLREKVKKIKEELIKRMHSSPHKVGEWLKSVLLGYYRYFGVHENMKALNNFRNSIIQKWKKILGRRSQRSYMTWEEMKKLIDKWIPLPKAYHKYPNERFGV